ncbi:hypothetical protein, partial [Rhizocola hellebori]|uniref:hypothetical protein n=1 Tax=Rhizocola hellebori TaxID=1392758 RepID=UPI0019447135
ARDGVARDEVARRQRTKRPVAVEVGEVGETAEPVQVTAEPVQATIGDLAAKRRARAAGTAVAVPKARAAG